MCEVELGGVRLLTMFALRFGLSEIETLAELYVAANSDQEAEDAIETVISPRVRARGCYKKDEFLELCRWKTPRSKKHCASNADAFVDEATAVALGASDERLRIGALTLLKGVSFPTASVLLHFGSADPYPILDFRALEALGAAEPSWYSFEFWWDYVVFCRGLADQAGVSMRTLDRAMWQWSKNLMKP